MAPPSASSPSASPSSPYKLPAAPLIARNLSTLLSNGFTTASSSALPIEALRNLLVQSRPPLPSEEAQAGSSAASSQPQTQALDALPIINPLTLLLTTSNPPLQAQLNTPQARADLLDLAQGLALALARPQDGVAVAAAGATAGVGSSASASAILSLVESRLLLAACYVVLALLPPTAGASTQEAASNGQSNPASRLAQASTQLDVARDELREAQRRHNSSLKERRRNDSSPSTPGEPTPDHDDDVLLSQQLAQHQVRLLLASANVAHVAGRPDHEVRRLLGWWVKARGQAGMGRGEGK